MVETKSVMGDEVEYYIYYEYEGDLLRKQIFKNENSSEEDYEILYEYNQQGLKTKKIDSLKGTTLYQYDKNDEYIETGIIWGDEFLTTKYKKITLCSHWKKGKIKSKRVYTLYRNEYSGSKK